MKLNSTNNVDTNLYELSVEVDGSTFDTAVNNVYRRQAKKISIPGFRKGKATRGMIERFYGAEIFYEDALNDLLPNVIDEAIKESKLDVVGFSYDDLEMGDIGKDGFSFKLKVTVKPEVEVGEYKGLTVEKPSVEVTDEDIDAELKRVQERNSRIMPVEGRAAEDGDISIIDFEGFVDGEAFEGGSGTDFNLRLGSGQFVPGFEDQIISHNPGDEFDVNVTFPEDYFSENLKGKDAVFHVKLKELKYRELPELDDEFAKDVSEFDTLDEYKADIANKLKEDKEHSAEDTVEELLADQLIDGLTGEIPELMYERNIENEERDISARFKSQGISLEDYLKYTNTTHEDFHNNLRPGAEKRVKLRLALEKIVKLENIQITDDELDKEYERIAEEYDMKPEQIKNIIDPDDLNLDLCVGKAMDLVKENANIQ